MSNPSNSDSFSPVLTARERSQIELLARLYYLNNGLKIQPTKYRVVGACSGSTRSLRFKAIGLLIDKKLATNEWDGSHPVRYALQITELGEKEVQHWASKSK